MISVELSEGNVISIVYRCGGIETDVKAGRTQKNGNDMRDGNEKPCFKNKRCKRGL